MTECAECGAWKAPPDLKRRAEQAELSATAMAKQANRFKRERDEARAKVERLRAALQKIADLPAGRAATDNSKYWGEHSRIARAALEDK